MPAKVPLLQSGEEKNQRLITKKCFVLSPFSSPFNEYYKGVLAPAIRAADLEPIRADDVYGPVPIINDIVEGIRNSVSLVADVTGRNPNVNYELGLAHAFGRPVVIISQSIEDIPFDYRHLRVVIYDTGQKDWESKLQTSIINNLKNAKTFRPSLSPMLGVPASDSTIGVCGLYEGDTRDFENSLLEAISRSQEIIVFIGWGLAFIAAQNRTLTNALKDHLRAAPKLVAKILMADPAHPGLIARLQEEERVQKEVGIINNWPATFYDFLQRELPGGLTADERRRLCVYRLSYMPTAMVLKLDDRFFFRPYGPPNQGGWASPWLEIDSAYCSEPWLRYLQNFVEFALQDVDDNDGVVSIDDAPKLVPDL